MNGLNTMPPHSGYLYCPTVELLYQCTDRWSLIKGSLRGGAGVNIMPSGGTIGFARTSVTPFPRSSANETHLTARYLLEQTGRPLSDVMTFSLSRS